MRETVNKVGWRTQPSEVGQPVPEARGKPWPRPLVFLSPAWRTPWHADQVSCFAWSVGIFGVVGLFMGPAGTSFTRVTEEHLSSSLSPASLGEEPWGWASPGVLYPA